jgi:hypothetical protein
MKTKKQPLDKSQLKRLAMLEWKDGQPGCMTCLRELKIGSPVYQDQKTFLIYCAPCVEKK